MMTSSNGNIFRVTNIATKLLLTLALSGVIEHMELDKAYMWLLNTGVSGNEVNE